MRTNQESLEKFYIQSLDNDIIEYKVETIEILNDTDVEKMINNKENISINN